MDIHPDSLWIWCVVPIMEDLVRDVAFKLFGLAFPTQAQFRLSIGVQGAQTGCLVLI